MAPVWFFFQGLLLLKASPTVMSLEICFELKMVIIYISLNEEANKDFRKPFSLHKFGHENDSFGKKYFNEGEIHCVEFKGYSPKTIFMVYLTLKSYSAILNQEKRSFLQFIRKSTICWLLNQYTPTLHYNLPCTVMRNLL
ncbi:hypothetical protein ERO13_D10G219932v2 [Gossypium hirsutum]|uniref:Secreted protein n=2 Tax=Gossypium TaxID=3633 RepID=A0A5D2TE97_GOSMU|nr:hypothetical protein ERO13_D10G219932v2 [Gossypium hirsutum]TYH51381.1 hypothetical protein ES332_D10G269000v1 [Gossypium tomentosum]TYI62554.1 hypothetical protein E1A91_D10G252600v1 [Gossypium mustelinum]